MGSLQFLQVFRDKPKYLVFGLAMAMCLSTAFLYFDYFLFFQPLLIFYIPPNGFWLLFIDLILSVLSGLVVSLSVYQLLSQRSKRTRTGGSLGVAGIIAALFAGACPCYYLIPVLAASASAGSLPLGLSVFFNTYEIEIKLLSLVVIGFSMFTLERSLRAYCKIEFLPGQVPPKTENTSAGLSKKQT